MKPHPYILRRVLGLAVAAVLPFALAGCAISPPVSPDRLSARPGAVTVPYRISDAGHLIMDIRINGLPPKPFLVDTGASISAVYTDYAPSLGLNVTEETVSVIGLTGSGLRPLAENIEFQIGEASFRQDKIVVLDRLKVDNEAVGLVGVDVLAEYVLQFNNNARTVTLIEGDKVDRSDFSGWQQIPLRNRVKGYPDSGLYFASVELKGKETPVLIDTGSELSIINWPLASLDPQMKKVRRQIRDKINFEGAIDSFPLKMRTVFFDVKLGDKSWPEIPVFIMDFDTLTPIAPADKPLMIAGVDLFTSSTFAFDFKDNMIYVRPED